MVAYVAKDKEIEYTKDETGKIIGIVVDGKAVKPASMRGFKKAQTLPYWRLFNISRAFQNPYSGVIVNLNPLEASIYNFCNEWYNRYDSGEDAGAPLQTYDDMKYFLLEINVQAYMDLID